MVQEEWMDGRHREQPHLAGINKMQGPSQKITEHGAAEPKGVARGKDKGQNSYRREQTVNVGSSISNAGGRC